jgi:hypothetical protein
MVFHVAYREERYKSPEHCVAGIRQYVAQGWDICELRGPSNGPYVVLFRIEDEQHPAEFAARDAIGDPGR